MAFTDTEKHKIRLYMGMPRLFAQANSILENCIRAIEGLSAIDGGAAEADISASLVLLDNINNLLTANTNLMLATEVVGEVKFDAGRQAMLLRSEGRKLINRISIPLGMRPVRDFFSNVQLAPIEGAAYPGES